MRRHCVSSTLRRVPTVQRPYGWYLRRVRWGEASCGAHLREPYSLGTCGSNALRMVPAAGRVEWGGVKQLIEGRWLLPFVETAWQLLLSSCLAGTYGEYLAEGSRHY